MRCAIEVSDFFKDKLLLSFPLLMDTSGLGSHENLPGLRVGTPRPPLNEKPRSYMAIAPGSLLPSHLLGQSARISANLARTVARTLETRFSTG